MVDLATILEIDGEDFFCSTIDFNINQNLGFAETKYGKRLVYERETCSERRPRTDRGVHA